MKTTATALKVAKNALESTDSWLWLLEVQLDSSTTLYLARSTERVTFDSQDYEAFPFSLGEIREDAEGNLSGLDLAVHDFTDEIRHTLDDFDLDDNDVTLRIVHSANLASASATIDETFSIKRIRGKDRQIVFTLGHANFLAEPFPKRRLLRNRCGWVGQFKASDTCGYSGAEPTCDGTLEGDDGCRAKSNVPRFGGAPALARGRWVV